ncbi:MAG TPA: SDR family oxidoreductase [Ktedonobacteraceae bacterium]|nr:SDR family oxidoreductase [Ktedonobacteraceae bacterium]
MKIVIFGAAGGTGRDVVEQALAAGHEVTAFDRNPAALTIQHPKLKLLKGDIFDTASVEEAVAGQDAVICVLGVKPTTTIPVCSVGTEHIIAAMQKAGVKRFICQSAFAVAALDGEWREVPWVLPVILQFTPKVKAMFADKIVQEKATRQSDLDWIIVRPAQLTDGPKTEQYKAGTSLKIGLNSKISRADVADFLLKQVSDDTYLHQVPRLAY